MKEEPQRQHRRKTQVDDPAAPLEPLHNSLALQLLQNFIPDSQLSGVKHEIHASAALSDRRLRQPHRHIPPVRGLLAVESHHRTNLPDRCPVQIRTDNAVLARQFRCCRIKGGTVPEKRHLGGGQRRKRDPSDQIRVFQRQKQTLADPGIQNRQLPSLMSAQHRPQGKRFLRVCVADIENGLIRRVLCEQLLQPHLDVRLHHRLESDGIRQYGFQHPVMKEMVIAVAHRIGQEGSVSYQNQQFRAERHAADHIAGGRRARELDQNFDKCHVGIPVLLRSRYPGPPSDPDAGRQVICNYPEALLPMAFRQD